MVLVLEGGRAEVNQSNLSIEQYLSLRCLSVDSGGGGWNSTAIRERLVRTFAQKDVFWLQVGVNEIQVVQD